MRLVVFLSSTGADLAEHRRAVIDNLAGHDHFICDAQEQFGARPSSPLQFCERRAREADIYVGLIGHYRGWEPPTDPAGRSITAMEYDWAEGKPRLVFILPDGQRLPAPESEDESKRHRQSPFAGA